MASSDRRSELKKLIFAYRASQCVYVATVLGIPDHIAGGSKTAPELAVLTGADSQTLERLLRALVELGILSRDNEGRFRLAPVAEPLRGAADGSLRAEVLLALGPSSWMPWGHLLESVRSGKAAFPVVFGCDAWEYRAQHPEARAVFDAMAAERSKAELEVILELLALPESGLIVDLGGGKGELLAYILAQRPSLDGLLFEQPNVVADAEKVLNGAGVGERCRVVGGDFTREVPTGGDVYLLKAIVHNWDDSTAVDILRNCRRAMPSRARLVIIETVSDAQRSPSNELQDLHMLVTHGGRERTAKEFTQLLRTAGFSFQGIRMTGEGSSLIEAVPG